jgi:hypothetical protein
VKNLNSKIQKKFMSITISKAISVGLYQSEKYQIYFAVSTSLQVNPVHIAGSEKDSHTNVGAQSPFVDGSLFILTDQLTSC